MSDSPFTEGSAVLSPADAVQAGDAGCWTLTFTAGESGLPAGSAIRVSIPHGFTPPQVDNPNASGYVQASIGNPDVSFSLAVEPVPGEGDEPFREANREAVYLFLERVPLKTGDRIRIVYGAGPGRAYASAFAGEAVFETHICTDAGADSERFLPVQSPPALNVRAGGVHRLEVTAPSRATAGSPLTALVMARDAFGNRCAGWSGWLKVDSEAKGVQVAPARKYEDPNGAGIEIQAGTSEGLEGPVYLRVREEDRGLQATGNPILTGEAAPFWGDLHACMPEAHRVQSTLDFELSVGEMPTVRQNFFRFSSSTLEDDEAPDADTTPLRFSLPDAQSDEMLSPHLLEIYSCWGNREYWGARRPDIRFDRHANRTAQAVLAQGVVAGFAAGSNSRFGLDRDARRAEAGRGYPGGLTAVYTPSLTHNAIFSALKTRRCYATTGARMILQFQIGDYGMGEFVDVSPVERALLQERRLTATVYGTAMVDRIEVIRNNLEVCTYRGDGKAVSFAWADRQELTRIALPRAASAADLTCYYYIRVTQTDGEIAWSSPIWFRVKGGKG